MAIGLENYVNIDNSDPTNYPFGAINDDDGSNNGTPVDRATYNDYHVFFRQLLALASIVPNGLPESASNIQYLLALAKYVRAQQADETQAGTLEVASDAETLAGTANDRAITPKKLLYYHNQAWTSVNPTASSYVNGSNFVPVHFRWRRVGTMVTVRFRCTVDATSAGDVVGIVTIPASLGITAIAPQTTNAITFYQPSDSTPNYAQCIIGNGTDYTKMVFRIPNVTSAGTLIIDGQISFEIAP